MVGETIPTPGDYPLLTLVLPPQATKSVWSTSPSLVAYVWLPEPGTQSALILVTLHRGTGAQNQPVSIPSWNRLNLVLGIGGGGRLNWEGVGLHGMERMPGSGPASQCRVWHQGVQLGGSMEEEGTWGVAARFYCKEFCGGRQLGTSSPKWVILSSKLGKF